METSAHANSDLVYPYGRTEAAQMLAAGLRRKSETEGVSLRELGKKLKYKQAVVLSHMATGRVPIPIDRAIDFADELQLDKRDFLLAVLRQRHPHIDWSLVTASPSFDAEGLDEAVAEFQLIAGKSFDQLTKSQLRVMREAAADPNPARRWLSVHEVPAVELLRELRPTIAMEGLPAQDRRTLKQALES